MQKLPIASSIAAAQGHDMAGQARDRANLQTITLHRNRIALISRRFSFGRSGCHQPPFDTGAMLRPPWRQSFQRLTRLLLQHG